MSRRIFTILSACLMILGIGACSPNAYVMNLEMRYPSTSGFDVYGKTVSVVYMETGSESDTAFTYHVADGFAKRIEEDFFNSEPEVKLYKLPKHFGNYADKDTLRNLVMDTDNDVIFLIDAPAFTGQTEDAATSSWRVPFNLGVYAYDSMNKKDSVYKYVGKSAFYGGTLDDRNSVWKSSSDAAYMVGYNSASKFSPDWREEAYTVVYYDEESWINPLEDALSFKWQDAIDKWMTLASTKNPMKRSSASYDVALGCYMLGQYNLALKWLAQSDQDCVLSLSGTLRRRIINRMAQED